MVKIFLVRHGQTDYNVQKRIQGRMPVPLNEKGRSQAKDAGLKLKDISIDAIFSSPNPRAAQTAQAIAEHHSHLDIEHLNFLLERSFGRLEGSNHEERLRLIPDIEDQWAKYKFDWKPPEGQSVKELHSETKKGLFSFLNEHKDKKNVVVVSHGGTIRSLLLHLMEKPIEHFFKLRNPDNCEIIEIDWDGKKANIKFE